MSARKLNKKEIDDILSIIKPNPYIPKDTDEYIRQTFKQRLLPELQAVSMHPSMIPIYRDQILRQYLYSLVQPGEMVGVICAQSYGERSTQGNLSHFHKAGTAGNESIVTRQSELMNASSKIKNPTFHIYFTNPNGNAYDSIPSLRKVIGSNLVQLSLEKLSLSTDTILNKEDEPWYEAFYSLYGDRDPKFKHCISFKINMEMLYEYNITLENLVDRIYSLYTDREYIYALFSPECFGRLDLFFDTDSIATLEEPVLYVTEETKDELCLGEQILPVLESYNLYGIPSIENVFFVKGKNWYVQTENIKEKSIRNTKKKEKGKKTIDSSVRFKQILALDIVDSTQTISNNIWDIYYTFGIEAVRQYMIDEFIILTQGINLCHILLLVDKMTFSGSIASMSRYSMRDDAGTSIFAKASFEETLDNFLNAGAFGQEEPVKGVSASIICARRAGIGTGLCNLAMDLEMLEK